RGKGSVLKIRAAGAVIEGRCVSSEIGFDDIEISVEIVVSGGDAHSSLRFAIGAESAAGFHGDVGEFSGLGILLERARGGIVGDVDVRPAIVIEVRGEDTKAVGTVGLEDAGGIGDVGKGAVAIVAIEDVFSTKKAWRAAGDHYTFI